MLYSDICNSEVTLDVNWPSECSAFTFQDQSEPYYEFDALITVARRTYDALRYILWPVFGPGGGHTPSNFPKTLDSCCGLPENLQDVMSNSWSTHGVKLTAYRDCIQHYVPVSFGIDTALVERVAGDTWSVLLRIPDNPETKSQRNFVFALRLDALTYGWELANELISIAAELVAAIPVMADRSDDLRDVDHENA